MSNAKLVRAVAGVAAISHSHYFKASPRINSDSLPFTTGRFPCLSQSHRQGQIGILFSRGLGHARLGHFFPNASKRRSARCLHRLFLRHVYMMTQRRKPICAIWNRWEIGHGLLWDSPGLLPPHWIAERSLQRMGSARGQHGRPLWCSFPLLQVRFDSGDMNNQSIGRGGSTFQPQTAPRRSHGYLASGYETGSSNVCSILHMKQ